MKEAAIIFTVVMLFFTAQPILLQCQASVLKAASGMGSCSKKSCPKKSLPQKPDNKDCTNTCNPFASCSQCHYIAASKIGYAAGIELAAAKKMFSRNEDIRSEFLADCWHPPEMVSHS